MQPPKSEDPQKIRGRNDAKHRFESPDYSNRCGESCRESRSIFLVNVSTDFISESPPQHVANSPSQLNTLSRARCKHRAAHMARYVSASARCTMSLTSRERPSVPAMR